MTEPGEGPVAVSSLEAVDAGAIGATSGGISAPSSVPDGADTVKSGKGTEPAVAEATSGGGNMVLSVEEKCSETQPRGDTNVLLCGSDSVERKRPSDDRYKHGGRARPKVKLEHQDGTGAKLAADELRDRKGGICAASGGPDDFEGLLQDDLIVISDSDGLRATVTRSFLFIHPVLAYDWQLSWALSCQIRGHEGQRTRNFHCIPAIGGLIP